MRTIQMLRLATIRQGDTLVVGIISTFPRTGLKGICMHTLRIQIIHNASLIFIGEWDKLCYFPIENKHP